MESNWSRSIFVLGMLLLAAVRFAPAALADSPAEATQRELRIERTLACPQCTDLPLDVCDQDICGDMRAIVRQKVAAGESDPAIRQYFVDRYGARVLLAPPKESLGLVAWLLPFVALLVGGGISAAFIRSARRRSLTSGPTPKNWEWGAVVGEGGMGTQGVLPGYRSRVERDVLELE